MGSHPRSAQVPPNVRFIFVRRDHFDTALRIFMKPYRSGNHYAYDLKSIFEHLAWYDRMIDAKSSPAPSSNCVW